MEEEGAPALRAQRRASGDPRASNNFKIIDANKEAHISDEGEGNTKVRPVEAFEWSTDKISKVLWFPIEGIQAKLRKSFGFQGGRCGRSLSDPSVSRRVQSQRFQGSFTNLCDSWSKVQGSSSIQEGFRVEGFKAPSPTLVIRVRRFKGPLSIFMILVKGSNILCMLKASKVITFDGLQLCKGLPKI